MIHIESMRDPVSTVSVSGVGFLFGKKLPSKVLSHCQELERGAVTHFLSATPISFTSHLLRSWN